MLSISWELKQGPKSSYLFQGLEQPQIKNNTFAVVFISSRTLYNVKDNSVFSIKKFWSFSTDDGTSYGSFHVSNL